jgi:hypothetical protein
VRENVTAYDAMYIHQASSPIYRLLVNEPSRRVAEGNEFKAIGEKGRSQRAVRRSMVNGQLSMPVP